MDYINSIQVYEEKAHTPMFSKSTSIEIFAYLFLIPYNTNKKKK